MKMDDSVEGVDWHSNGVDVPPWVYGALTVVLAVPVGLMGFLGVLLWFGR